MRLLVRTHGPWQRQFRSDVATVNEGTRLTSINLRRVNDQQAYGNDLSDVE